MLCGASANTLDIEGDQSWDREHKPYRGAHMTLYAMSRACGARTDGFCRKRIGLDGKPAERLDHVGFRFSRGRVRGSRSGIYDDRSIHAAANVLWEEFRIVRD